MHLAPMRRRPSRPSPAASRFLPLVAVLLLVGGCALPDPGPSPMVCPSTPGGCAEEDAPWYRQDVTAMIPPPPVEPLPTPDPDTTAEPVGEDTTIGDPSAAPHAARLEMEPVVSSFARPDRATDTEHTLPSSATAPTEATTRRPPAAAAGNERSGQAERPTPDNPSKTVVRLASDRLFELGGATLQPTGRRALDAFADRLHGTDYTRIRVIGHTDRSGKAATNLKLSRERARIVRDHLVTRGIPAEALDHEGRGSRDAVVDPDRCGRQKDVRIRCLAPDRRIDIVITRRRAP